MPARILAVAGTRPEVVKLAPVLRALAAEDWAEPRLLVTAQHRELLDRMLAFFELRADGDLDLMRPDQDLASLTSRMVRALDEALAREAPAAVLAQGDTTTVFVTALCCFYRGIPFGHVEAGLRTGDARAPFPEEMNRRLTAPLARWHFAPTRGAAANLAREAIPDARIFVTGNTVVDALALVRPKLRPERWRPAGGRKLVLVTAHRREHFGPRFAAVCRALATLATRPDVELLYPVHPNPNVAGPARRLLAGSARVRLVEPLDYPDFLSALAAADLVLTDSGGVQEEAPAFGVPVLVLRDKTERPEGIAAGVARLVGTDPERIVRAAGRLLDAAGTPRTPRPNPYGDGRAAARIAQVLAADLAGRARAFEPFRPPE